MTESEYSITKHSMAHLLAHAILNLYPDTKLGIGPATETGFYYEVDSSHKFTSADLPLLEQEMQNLISEDLPFVQLKVPRDQAYQTLLQKGQTYKIELLEQIEDDEISLYKTGDSFIDLCRGPHVRSSADLKYFKLTGLSRTRWLNDPSRPELQIIRGVAFPTKRKFNEFLAKQEEINQRNILTLGKNLQLLHVKEEKLVWLDRGNKIMSALNNQLNFYLTDAGFREIKTYQSLFSEIEYEKLIPELLAQDLYYPARFVYPVVKSSTHKIFKEFGSQESYLKAQLYTKRETAAQDLFSVTEIIVNFLANLGFVNTKIYLDTPDYEKIEKYNYHETEWDRAIQNLKSVLVELNLKIKIREGKAESFGPQLSFNIKDYFEREWEFARLGYRFPSDLNANENTETQSDDNLYLELGLATPELLAIIVEHYNGALPLWLNAYPAVLLLESPTHRTRADKIKELLLSAGINTRIDHNYYPEGNLQQLTIDTRTTNFFIYLGEKEKRNNCVSLFNNYKKDLGLLKVEELINKLNREIYQSKNN